VLKNGARASWNSSGKQKKLAKQDGLCKEISGEFKRAFSKFPLQKGAGYITIKASKPFRIERKQKEELK
jgi:hypothetical protein